MTNGFLTNQFQGSVKPIRKQKSTPPIWQEEIRIGEVDTPNSHLWTTFRLYIRPATRQYPNAGIFISFGNGEHFAFSKLNQNDLKKIKDFLDEYIDVATSIYLEEVRKGIILQEQLKQFDQLQQLAEQSGDIGSVQQLTEQVIQQLALQQSNPRPTDNNVSTLPTTAEIQPTNIGLNTTTYTTTIGGESITSNPESKEPTDRNDTKKSKKEKKS